jgi:hypothetical protein
MRKLLEGMAKAIVDYPDQVRVSGVEPSSRSPLHREGMMPTRENSSHFLYLVVFV